MKKFFVRFLLLHYVERKIRREEEKHESCPPPKVFFIVQLFVLLLYFTFSVIRFVWRSKCRQSEKPRNMEITFRENATSKNFEIKSLFQHQPAPSCASFILFFCLRGHGTCSGFSFEICKIVVCFMLSAPTGDVISQMFGVAVSQ